MDNIQANPIWNRLPNNNGIIGHLRQPALPLTNFDGNLSLERI